MVEGKANHFLLSLQRGNDLFLVFYLLLNGT